MPNTLPAICEQCGAVFPSPIGRPHNQQSVQISRIRVECPLCGELGHVPDGSYETVRGTLRMLLKDPVSADALQTLARILQASWEVRADQETVADRVEAEVPELRDFASSLRSLKIDWKFWLPFLVMIISLLAQLQIIGPQPVSDEQLERVLRKVVEHPTPTPQQSTTSTIGKTGRNSPCPCGSGKKYKHCHLRTAHSHGPSQPPGRPGP
jgi:hypothetical protein